MLYSTSLIAEAGSKVGAVLAEYVKAKSFTEFDAMINKNRKVLSI
jgi:hypothetical protein